MANINNTILSGSLASDPELRWLAEDGESGIVRLGLIVKRSQKVANPSPGEPEWEDHSSIFDVEVYGKFALAVARKLQKFDDVTVSGELVKDEWEDKDSGQNRSRIKITARQIDSPGLFRPKAEDRELQVSTFVGAQQKSAPKESSTPVEPKAALAEASTAAQTQAEAQVETAALTKDDIPF